MTIKMVRRGNCAYKKFIATSAAALTILLGAANAFALEIPAGAVSDLAGNPNEATSFSIADGIAPIVTFDAPASYSGIGNIDVTVTFDEVVTGLTDTDFVPANATVFGLVGSGQVYTLTLTPTGSGTIDVTLPDAAVTDAAGNPNAATTLSQSRTGGGNAVGISDGIAPTAQMSGPASYSGTDDITVTIEFSEDVTGLQPDDFVPTNATVGSVTGSGASYSVTITPAGNGNIDLELVAGAVTDAAGNQNIATSLSSQGASIIDGVGPQASIDGSDTYTSNSPVELTVTFDEPVNGFGGTGDVEITNGSWSFISGADGDTTYTIQVTPTGSGPIGLRIPRSEERSGKQDNSQENR